MIADYKQLLLAAVWQPVGYGDNVPTSAAGRFVAALVMLFLG